MKPEAYVFYGAPWRGNAIESLKATWPLLLPAHNQRVRWQPQIGLYGTCYRWVIYRLQGQRNGSTTTLAYLSRSKLGRTTASYLRYCCWQIQAIT